MSEVRCWPPAVLMDPSCGCQVGTPHRHSDPDHPPPVPWFDVIPCTTHAGDVAHQVRLLRRLTAHLEVPAP